MQQNGQAYLTVFVAAVSGIESPRTMRFVGYLQGQEVLILVDSGSSHYFITVVLAPSLLGA